MSTIEEIKQMRMQGQTEQEISQNLRQMGLSESEIASSLSQAQIKEAVSDQFQRQQVPPIPPQIENYNMQTTQSYQTPSTQEYEEMSPSMMSQEQPQEEYQYPTEFTDNAQTYQNQYQYQPYQSSISPDTMTEIAEQVMAEKISPITNKIERVIDMKTTFESRIEAVSERLKRIEKIIDRLQLSLLQKVGEYVTDVSDLKKELIQTQNSFKAVQKKKK